MNDSRKFIIYFSFVLVALVFLIKLFFLQVLDPNYKLAAENNIVQRIIEYPYRGLIYDRNGKLIVYNSPIYNLMVVPREVQRIDTTLFCQVFNIEKEEYIEKIQSARKYSTSKPSLFIKQLSNEDFARVQDFMVDFPGFYISARTVRSYSAPSLANALGYIGEIDKRGLERDTTKYYRQGDYIGISGIESRYEEQLRGERGVRFRMVNVRGVEKGAFKKGSFDTLSVPGENLISTIDLDLQKYGEMLMEGKVGSIVAIEPATGEILSIVSAPSYDPNMLTGRKFGFHFSQLNRDSLNPLFNRPIMAMYPPGSIFKTVQALIALEEKVLYPETRIVCNRAIISCHGAHSNEDLKGALVHSCNPYFHNTFKRIINQNKVSNTYTDSRIGLERWLEHIASFGLGQPLGIDLPNEKSGNIPTPNFYNRIYGENRWAFSTIYSLSIGQGEIMVTPVQMANLVAIIANKGFYYTPHLIKSTIGYEDPEWLKPYKEKRFTTVDEKHYTPVIEAMADVVKYGTGSYRAKVSDVEICGKTGTVQNPHGEDHSVFVAFAPKDNPQIAISVYVENAGQGARAAASIASLMIEKYLKGSTNRPHIEEYVLRGQFLH